MLAPGVVGKNALFFFFLNLLLLLGGSGWLFVELKGLGGFRAIAFFLLSFLPFSAALIFPKGPKSFRNFFLFATAFPVAASLFFFISGRALEFNSSFYFGFWILSFSCIAFSMGICSLFAREHNSGFVGPIVVLLLSILLIGSVWILPALDSLMAERVFLALNPLGALCDLISFDWLRDSELYFIAQSQEPIRYPNWLWYSAGAFLLGLAFWFAGHFWNSKPPKGQKI